MSNLGSPPSGSEPRGRRRLIIDLTPLRESPAYARLWIGGVVSGIGAQLTVVAVGVQIYDITGSTFAVALVGIIAFAPMIVVGLFGSTLVDAFDRRTVLIWAASISWLSAVGIAVLAWIGNTELAPLYALTTLSAVASTVVGTARFAILPRLVPRAQLSAAAALSGVSAGVQATIGPALAGILIAGVGYAFTYSIDVLLYSAAFIGIVTLPAIRPNGDRISLGPRSIFEGVRFLATSRSLRAPFVLHVVAMVLGRPQVLFPAISVTIIGGGPLVVGLLSSSAAIGVLASSAISGPLMHVRRHGVAAGWAAVAFGASILCFGLVIVLTGTSGDVDTVQVVPLLAACVCLFASGASDNVAAIFRTTMMQSIAPDAVRGRIQGLTTVALTAGPRLGDAWAGGAATIAALWTGPVVGGALIVAAALGITTRSRGIRDYAAEAQ